MHRKAIYALPLSATALALLLGAPLASAQDPGAPGTPPPSMDKGKKDDGMYGSPSGSTDTKSDKKDKDKDKKKDKKKKGDDKEKSGDPMK